MAANDKPVVTVKNGQIDVVPEPLKFTREQRNVNIIWRLDTPGFVFVADGIRIDGEQVAGGLRRDQNEIVECRVVANGRQFMCLNKNTRPGTYKYTIRLQGPDGRVIERDPTIFNDR